MRVLIVDDNIDAAEMLAEWLDAIGHDVRVAADGPTALEIAAEFKPDVALLDIGLPVMDGYEVARRLREQPGCARRCGSSRSPGTARSRTTTDRAAQASRTTSSSPSTSTPSRTPCRSLPARA